MKILFISLGCDKNLVDSEMMIAALSRHGYEMTDNEEEAEVIVVNTCCFIHDAKEESITTLLEMGRLKETACCKALIAAGCLAQRYQKEIETEIPEVDAIVGTSSFEKIVEVVDDVVGGKKHNEMVELSYLAGQDMDRIVTTGGYYSYLKIAEGCNKHCSYCIIPKIRGSYRSVPMEKLISQAESLAKQGVEELMIVAQETTVYGVDLYGRKMLPELLRKLCGIPGLRWIRVLYCYPEEITDELIEVMATEEKICHYIDMPIQHASDRILKRMGRRTTKEEIINIVGKIRKRIPDMAIRTTLITGFPGETKEDHQELLEFVEEMEFERLGVFTYSKEEDTPAAEMPDQILEEVKEKRQQELMECQQQIAFCHAQDMIAKKLKVLIEGELPEEGVYIGRTYQDAPNIDGYIFMPATGQYISGEFVDVLVTDAKDYDLIGEIQ